MAIIFAVLSMVLTGWGILYSTNTLYKNIAQGGVPSYLAVATLRGIVLGSAVGVGITAHEDFHRKWRHPQWFAAINILLSGCVVYAAFDNLLLAGYLYGMFCLLILVVMNYCELLADRAGIRESTDYPEELVEFMKAYDPELNHSWKAWFYGHPPMVVRLWWLRQQ